MSIQSITVTPTQAVGAYASVDQGGFAGAAAGSGFGAALQDALQGVVDAGHHADSEAATAIAGGGNITEVVTAVSKAELALQATSAIRDRVVAAYQDIMKMPI